MRASSEVDENLASMAKLQIKEVYISRVLTYLVALMAQPRVQGKLARSRSPEV
jgi:hypothetical protein